MHRIILLALVAVLAVPAIAGASHQTPSPPQPKPGPYLSQKQAVRMTAVLASRLMHRLHARSYFVGACDRPSANRLLCRVDFYGVNVSGCSYRSTVVKYRSVTRARLTPRDCPLG